MQSNYTVRVITSDEKEIQAVLHFRKMYFLRDAPLAAALKLDYQSSDRDEYWTSVLQQGVSVLALDDHGEIIGISLNELIRREDANSYESIPNTHAKGIIQLLLHLQREDKMWEKLPNTCNTVLEIQNCAVHCEWRGKGIMADLCAETERIALAVGAGALRMEAKSAFAAKAAEKCGFKEIYRLPYKDQTYTPQPAPPHLEARVYIKELGTN